MKKALLAGMVFLVFVGWSNANEDTKSTSNDIIQECYTAMGMMNRWVTIISANNGWCADADNANTALKWIQKAKSVCPKDMQTHLKKEEAAAIEFRDIAFSMCRKGF